MKESGSFYDLPQDQKTWKLLGSTKESHHFYDPHEDPEYWKWREGHLKEVGKTDWSFYEDPEYWKWRERRLKELEKNHWEIKPLNQEEEEKTGLSWVDFLLILLVVLVIVASL